MKTEKETKEFLEELKKRGYNRHSINMQYEHYGAVEVLEWALDAKKIKPPIGSR